MHIYSIRFLLVIAINLLLSGCGTPEQFFSLMRMVGPSERYALVARGKSVPDPLVLRIRAATPRDTQQLYDLRLQDMSLQNTSATGEHDLWFPRQRDALERLVSSRNQQLEGPFNKLLVAEVCREGHFVMIGCLELYLSTPRAYAVYQGFDGELSIMIAPAARRSGYASLLITTLIAYAQDYFDHAQRVFAYVYRDRPWNSGVSESGLLAFDFKEKQRQLTLCSRVHNDTRADVGGKVNAASLALHRNLGMFEEYVSGVHSWFVISPQQYVALRSQLAALVLQIKAELLTCEQIYTSPHKKLCIHQYVSLKKET